MANRRKVRRMVGFIARYASYDLLRWGVRADGRDKKGQRWQDTSLLLKIALLGLLAGCKGPSEVEELTDNLSLSARRQLGIRRRLPDNTLGEFLAKLDPMALHHMLHVAGYDAWRRKALHQRADIPFGVLSMDGKVTRIKDTSGYAYSQVHHTNGVADYSLIRTINACKITDEGRPLLGSLPLLGSSNEVGSFQQAFGEMVRIYGRSFRVVMYDAGGTSESNADAVITAGKDYIFLVANETWQMLKHIHELFAGEKPVLTSEELVSESRRVVRKIWLREVKPTEKNLVLWEHTRTVIQIDNEVYENGEHKSTYRRYAVSSLPCDTLTPEQWLRLHVLRWGVEVAHNILDTAFNEDERPWFRKSAQGALAVQLLRRVAYTLLTLFRQVTIRNDDDRLAPWRRYLDWIRDALENATDQAFEGLRPRVFQVPPALA